MLDERDQARWLGAHWVSSNPYELPAELHSSRPGYPFPTPVLDRLHMIHPHLPGPALLTERVERPEPVLTERVESQGAGS